MNRHLTILALALLWAASSSAQSTPSKADEPCFFATDKTTWSALGLTTEQIEVVMDLQTACKTDCTIVPEGGSRDPKTSAALLEQYQERVRNVVSAEQYKNWLEWCEERTVRGAK